MKTILQLPFTKAKATSWDKCSDSLLASQTVDSGFHSTELDYLKISKLYHTFSVQFWGEDCKPTNQL